MPVGTVAMVPFKGDSEWEVLKKHEAKIDGAISQAVKAGSGSYETLKEQVGDGDH